MYSLRLQNILRTFYFIKGIKKFNHIFERVKQSGFKYSGCNESASKCSNVIYSTVESCKKFYLCLRLHKYLVYKKILFYKINYAQQDCLDF